MNISAETIFDTPHSISVAWAPFQARLADVLAGLTEDQCLVLSSKQSHKVVQFAAQGSFGLRVETLSNYYLPEGEQLNKQQISILLSMGWREPTKTADSTPESDIDGSPNYFLEFPAPVCCEAVASLSVETFTKVLRLPHPAHLQYYAFDSSNGQEIELPELGLKADNRTPQGDLSDLLINTIRKITGIAELAYDSDHDIGIRYGSSYTYVQIVNEGKHVRMFSIILCDVRENHNIYVRLNDLNAHETLARFFFKDRSVYCVADVRASPFVSDHISEALLRFSNVCDGMGLILQQEFGGRVAFNEVAQNAVVH